MKNAEITGWGKCLPPAVLTNSDLEKVVDTSDDWITTRTGIKERRVAHVEMSDMAVVAAQRALSAAGLTADDIDLIILATCTPDTLIPAGAAHVQAKLGATRAGAFDLNAACSGFLYGLVTGTNMIRGGTHERVLVIGAEKLRYVTDYSDRTTCVLFGDGAGAVVIEATNAPVGLLSSELGIDGETAGLLCVPGGGTAGDPGDAGPGELGVRMEGPDVFRRAVTMMGDASARVVEQAGLTLEDVDILVPHQANVRIIDATARRLGLPSEKVFVNIQSYGNTSAATIPIALTEALEAGRIEPGSTIVFAAFGGGLTWAAGVLRWGDRVTPLGESDAELPSTDLSALDIIQPNLDFYGIAPREAGS